VKAAFLMAALLLAGCTTRELYYNGVIYTHRSFGVRQSIGELSVTQSTNGVTVRMRGYNSDQTEALGVIAEKAAEGAARGMKP